MVELFNVPDVSARKSWVDLSRQIESPPENLDGEVFFHAEPYDVACDLAGARNDFRLHQNSYEQILSQHRW
ncbi:MAG: hypothetical protein C5B59_03995 [Bacteroidetes bacterium]|nr:MAG: hypothetical protein C5B59_03995 [Bacteroidota bacterium]